jgi:UDP-glucuronate 4-epimerase
MMRVCSLALGTVMGFAMGGNGDGGSPAKRRVTVIGGAGFIGSTLVDRLLSEKWDVTAIDCFDPFYAREVKQDNLLQALRSSAFNLIEVDTRDRSALLAAVEHARPEVVIDLAARAGVRPSIADPDAYIDNNVRGLQHTLAATRAVGARLVFASSSSVYGADPRRPFKEDQMDGRPLSPYGATKVAGEALVHAHHANTGLPVAIARLFTVYGPRQRPDLAINSFARAMLAAKPIKMFDGGRGSRDYTYVDDVVDALVRLIHAPGAYLLVNVGGHSPVTTTELVDRLESALGVRAIRQLAPAQPGDVPATYADISRARDVLGWEPRVGLNEGLSRFCTWLRPRCAPASHGEG